MKKNGGLFSILLVLSMLLTACHEGEEIPSGVGPDPNQAEYSASFGSLQGIEVGTPFTYCDPYWFEGTMECTVTDVRLVTEESQCPPDEWFFAELLVMNFEIGRAKIVERDEWFTEGGAFDQGCRILVVDVALKNIDAKGLPDDEGGISNDPTAFDMTAIMSMVDTSIVLNASGDYPTYQSFTEMGFSRFNEFIPDEYVDSWDPYIFRDSTVIQIPKGEAVSFCLCYPIYQNNDGSPRDLSKLALLANEAPGTEAVIMPLNLED